jgi:hypothetical protein
LPDLRWRIEGYKHTFRRVVITSGNLKPHGRAQQRAIYMVCSQSARILAPVDWTAWGERYPERRMPGHPPSSIWWSATKPSQPIWRLTGSIGNATVRRPRGADGALRGFLALLDLTAAMASDRAID